MSRTPGETSLHNKITRRAVCSMHVALSVPAYGVIGLSTTFLIGRDGRPVALPVGPREWTGPPAKEISKALLAEQVALKRTR